MLLGEISGALVKAIQENVESVRKGNIYAKSPPDEAGTLPSIFVHIPSFTFDDAGLGGAGAEVKEEKSEAFSGNGERTAFSLAGKPQRPLIRVEAPPGQVQLENIDYRMDYSKGTIVFRSAPPKGRQNVSVRYNSASGSGRTREVHLGAVCNVDVWAGNEKQRDDIAIDVIKAVALSQEELSGTGMQVRPVEGKDLPDSDLPKGVRVRRLVYSVEANLQVKVPAARIERVDVKQLPPK